MNAKPAPSGRKSAKPMRTHEKSGGINLGLAICGALLKPGQCLTQEDIAAFAGCSPQRIGEIERQALRKLHRKLSKELSQQDIENLFA